MTEISPAEQPHSGTGFSQERLAAARNRVAPRLFQQLRDEPGRVDNPQTLTSDVVQKKCFDILGYMEEYYRIPSLQSPVEQNGDSSNGRRSELRTLEAELDSILTPSSRKLTREEVLAPRVDEVADEDILQQDLSEGEIVREKLKILSKKEHQAAIKAKLQDLLAYPQVRERFEHEFEAEFALYQAARRPMREVRDIDRVSEKLKQAIYRKYLDSRQQHGKLTQSVADQIGYFQGKLTELEEQERGIEETASPSTVGYLETQRLLQYKRELKEKGFALTPSRWELIDRITQEAVAGNKIFLVGSIGTGKTKLAFYALNSITGGYELINWHEGTSPRDIFGYRELWTDDGGGVESGMKPGPVPKALEKGVGVVHEEYTGGSTRTQLAAKFMMGARPGESIQIPGFNGQVFEVTNNFLEIFTGNPKDERTKQREDMDPAILRELTGVEVSYMPAAEMDDIIRAMLIEENGVLKLSTAQAEYIERLTKAAELMQRIHNRDFEGFSPELKSLLGIDAQGNTETRLNTNFLDPGTLFKLFSEWELASARGQKFSEYMATTLGEFINDPKTLSTPEERRTLQEVLHEHGLITSATSEPQVVIAEQEKGYILPSQMAGETALAQENPMGATATVGKKGEGEGEGDKQELEAFSFLKTQRS